ncbi:MAG TPA: hypothetical protein VGD62_10670, partial [Acidobacteriaceae bacterium]
YADNYFGRVNLHGRVLSQPQFDAAAEIGGYIPGRYTHDKLFFYGAYNPALNESKWMAPTAPAGDVATLSVHGPFANLETINSWAAKVSFRPDEIMIVDASAFGDPSRTNSGLGVVNEDTFPFYPNANVTNNTSFSRWNYGTRSESLHITLTPSATWATNLTASAKTSHFTESPQNPELYQIQDYSGIFQSGEYNAQGLGFFQNPKTQTYTFGVDTEKTVKFLGQQHTLSLGYNVRHDIYDLTKSYTGPQFSFPTTNAAGVASPAGLSGATANATFQLQAADATCPLQYCPMLNGTQVYLEQVGGIYSSLFTPSSMSYNVAWANDNFDIGHRVTINAGIRWDQEQLNGISQSYVFTDNWSPRLGINIDPKGDRKQKIFFNWGRYTQELPEDAAIRSLGQELDIYNVNWTPQNDGHGNAIVNANGTVNPILDAAHLISGVGAAGNEGSAVSYSSSSFPELIQPGTKLNFEEEFVGGIEKQIAGFAIKARYTDRRLLRILEDQSGASPEGAQSGFVGQSFLLGNPSSKSDYFTNEIETPYTYNAALPNHGAPANCQQDYNRTPTADDGRGIGGPFINSAGVVAGPGGVCGSNGPNAGAPVPDGMPDGEPNPRRHYQAVELEANRNFSRNFLLRVNYRWAKLYGNYEGLYRNDNGQSDPGISSLFDFSQGVLDMLGDQYVPGFLNTDRRNVGNVYGSYVVPSGFMKRLTAGMGFRGSSGQPITNFGAHPVYHSSGEIPLGGRGSEGRNASNYQLDVHTDYPTKLGEKYSLKVAFDAFNITNSRSLLSVDQDSALSYGDPNKDFLKPLAFQRAIYGRGSVRLEF